MLSCFTLSIFPSGAPSLFLMLLTVLSVFGVASAARNAKQLSEIPAEFYGYACSQASAQSFLALSAPIALDPPSSSPYNFSSKKPNMSYSQWKQDTILAPILNQIRNGFFVESGARDGESDSNTVYFESRGWQGLLVEPGAEYFKIAAKHRKAYVFHGALSPTAGSEKLSFDDSADGLSHFDNRSATAKRFQVQAEPLEKLLAAIDPGRKSVDFWSLDIEGSEAAVLESTNFEHITVGVLIIEMNKTPENNRRISAVMKRNGFQDIGRTLYKERVVGYLDHVFVNPAYFADRGLTLPGRVQGLY